MGGPLMLTAQMVGLMKNHKVTMSMLSTNIMVKILGTLLHPVAGVTSQYPLVLVGSYFDKGGSTKTFLNDSKSKQRLLKPRYKEGSRARLESPYSVTRF